MGKITSLADTFSAFFGNYKEECMVCGTSENLTWKDSPDGDGYWICSKCTAEIEAESAGQAKENKRKNDLLNWIAETDK